MNVALCVIAPLTPVTVMVWLVTVEAAGLSTRNHFAARSGVDGDGGGSVSGYGGRREGTSS